MLLARADGRLYAMKARRHERVAVPLSVGGRDWGVLALEPGEIAKLTAANMALVEGGEVRGSAP